MREKCPLSSVHSLTHNSGICPDPESNQQPFACITLNQLNHSGRAVSFLENGALKILY